MVMEVIDLSRVSGLWVVQIPRGLAARTRCSNGVRAHPPDIADIEPGARVRLQVDAARRTWEPLIRPVFARRPERQVDERLRLAD